MTKQCHMWTNGERCNKQVTTEFYIRGGSTKPKPWSVQVCDEHAKFYPQASNYHVRYL